MKRAVLVGINTYPDPRDALRGCLNDVKMMYDLLVQKAGFLPDDIRVLTDSRATMQAILERIDWLIGGARPGDVLVFHYSGHGSQIRDRNGDELNDFKDEILCYYGAVWDNPLTDDVLGEYFKKLPHGVNMYLFFDCCHSGTVDRAMNSPENSRKARWIPPPLDISLRSEGRNLPLRKIGLKRTLVRKNGHGTREFVSLSSNPDQRHVMVSGCLDDKTAADAYIDGAYNGALTHYMVKAILANPTASVLQVHAIAKQNILQNGYSQESQLWGPKSLLDKPFFS